MSDAKLQDREFFSKVYAEFGDMNVMHAWFHMLLNRDIGKWEPVPANDVDTVHRLNQMTGCMTAPWTYVTNFFADEGWVTATDFSTWDYEITELKQNKGGKKRGTTQIRIIATRFWSDFKAWNKKSHSNRGLKESTFWTSMERIGIIPKRKQRFRGKLRTVVDLYYKDVQKGLRNHYGSQYKMPDWPTEDKDTVDQIISQLSNNNSHNFL